MARRAIASQMCRYRGASPTARAATCCCARAMSTRACIRIGRAAANVAIADGRHHVANGRHRVANGHRHVVDRRRRATERRRHVVDRRRRVAKRHSRIVALSPRRHQPRVASALAVSPTHDLYATAELHSIVHRKRACSAVSHSVQTVSLVALRVRLRAQSARRGAALDSLSVPRLTCVPTVYSHRDRRTRRGVAHALGACASRGASRRPRRREAADEARRERG